MDKSHFNTFIFSNANKIYSYVFCILKNPEETMDVVSLTIEECWKKSKNYSHSDLTYVFKIAKDLAKNKASYSNLTEKFRSDQEFEVNPVLKRFCVLIQDLAPVQAEVICLRSMIRLSIDEISIVVGIGMNNVHSILANTRKVIRAKIDPKGILNDMNCHEFLLKYYSGNTTLEEEEKLRIYILRMDLTEFPEADCELFKLFLEVGGCEMPKHYTDLLYVKIKELQNDNWRKSLSRFFLMGE